MDVMGLCLGAAQRWRRVAPKRTSVFDLRTLRNMNRPDPSDEILAMADLGHSRLEN